MDKVNKPKRFYKDASVEVVDGGWTVLLDGRALKTPAKAGLVLPSEALAQAIADEWQGQGETLELQAMTLTRLANVAIDRTPGTRAELAAELRRYGETDVTCYLAEHPDDLRVRQDAAWRPWRDWAGETLGVVLVPVHGLLASPQPEASLIAIEEAALAADDFTLTGLVWGCSLLGSAVLALAVRARALRGEAALEASLTDELYQAELWGQDDEALAVRAARRAEARALDVWFAALATR